MIAVLWGILTTKKEPIVESVLKHSVKTSILMTDDDDTSV